MNVLVTGGAGYIGSHACVELLNAGHSVVVADNLVNANAECLRRVERITGKTLEFHEMDLLNRAALNELFDTHRFDCVLHFAGLKAVGESVQQPLRYYNNNLGTTIHLCQTMAAHGVKKILFSSSATVYSPDNAMPVKESARTGGCTNPYGWTKYMSEQILTDTARADPDWTVMLLRIDASADLAPRHADVLHDGKACLILITLGELLVVDDEHGGEDEHDAEQDAEREHAGVVAVEVGAVLLAEREAVPVIALPFAKVERVDML